ncbi:mitochondrial acyl carrier protein [Dispira simplex]|nr:mitochondrial acyl carrier protein [Dispira simplex]
MLRFVALRAATRLSAQTYVGRFANARSASLITKVPSSSTLPTVVSTLPVNGVTARYYSAAPELTREKVEERVLEVLKDFDKVPQDKLTPKSDFAKDLGLDSLDIVEVVMAIEEEFTVEIPDKDADEIRTVGQAVDYIINMEGAA